VPSYLVLPNSTLRAIAETRPQTRDELARIRGVGPRALAKFGDELLSMLSVSSGSSTPHVSANEGPELRQGALLPEDEEVVVAIELDQPPVRDLVQKPLVSSG
jgi:hypothetical protein